MQNPALHGQLCLHPRLLSCCFSSDDGVPPAQIRFSIVRVDHFGNDHSYMINILFELSIHIILFEVEQLIEDLCPVIPGAIEVDVFEPTESHLPGVVEVLSEGIHDDSGGDCLIQLVGGGKVAG